MSGPTTSGGIHAGGEAVTTETWGVRDLHVVLGGRDALAGVDLDVGPSSLVVVMGGDGAGKTTLARVLVGALAPTSGTVTRPPAERLGYVSAAPGGFGELSVEQNLLFAARAYGIDASDRDSRIAAILVRVGLTTARDRLAQQLSGGMRRRLAVGMAVLHRPSLLVLDEPSTGIDPVGRAELWRLLGSLAVDGTAIAMSTTYADEAARADWVLVLADGRPLLAGTPEELLDRFEGAVGFSPDRPTGLPSWRHGAGWRVWSISGQLPAGAAAVELDLESAAVVAQLEREAAAVGAGA